jgi:amino acid transporter
MARNGNAPKALVHINRAGVPSVGLLVTFVAGCLVFLPFPGWQKFVAFQSAAVILPFGLAPIVMLAMRRQLPEQARPFRIRLPRTVGFLALWSSNLIVYWSGWDVIWKLMLVIALGCAALLATRTLGARGAAALDLRHGWWLLAWFAGVTVLSFLGSYPAPDAHAGNLGLLDPIMAMVAQGVLSALVLVLALHLALPAEQAKTRLDGQLAARSPRRQTT